MTANILDAARDRLRPHVERARTFTGWSSHVHSTLLEPRAWDYDNRATRLISEAPRVLDIGTGGGERLSRYSRGHHGIVVATESWAPNVVVAVETLRPQSIPVVHSEDEKLPFAPESFDLILNRHSGLNPRDVARILAPGGTFLTEQVWNHWRELKHYIPRMVEYRGYYTRFRDELTQTGLELVEARTSVVPAAYANLEDFVFMLCITPWTVPDFNPLGSDLEALLALERDRTTRDGIVMSDGHFLIEAHKPQ